MKLPFPEVSPSFRSQLLFLDIWRRSAPLASSNLAGNRSWSNSHKLCGSSQPSSHRKESCCGDCDHILLPSSNITLGSMIPNPCGSKYLLRKCWGMIQRVKYLLRQCLDPYRKKVTILQTYFREVIKKSDPPPIAEVQFDVTFLHQFFAKCLDPLNTSAWHQEPRSNIFGLAIPKF